MNWTWTMGAGGAPLPVSFSHSVYSLSPEHSTHPLSTQRKSQEAKQGWSKRARQEAIRALPS